jgi:hypothetical protein
MQDARDNLHRSTNNNNNNKQKQHNPTRAKQHQSTRIKSTTRRINKKQEEQQNHVARNSSRDAERAQDDGDGGNRFLVDKCGHVTFRVATQGVGPSAGDANFCESLEEAIAGL